MALPIITSPHSIFEKAVPSTNQKLSFRRMKVSDEKILLFAKESSDTSEIYKAILQVIQNCILTPGINVRDLCLFDIEYLFLHIRGQSINNIIDLSFTDAEDEQKYEFKINIQDIEVQKLNTIPKRIELSDKAGIIMKYPSAAVYDDIEFLSGSENSYEKLIVKCIDSIYDKETTHKATDYTDKELIDWVNNLEVKEFNKIDNFMSNLPMLKYVINYKNTKGTERTIELATLNDFFTLH